MEHLNLITDCLLAIFFNYQSDEENFFESPTNKLVADILATIPTSNVNGELNYEADTTEAIRRIINDMLNNKASPYYKYDMLNLKLMQTCRRNPQVYESLEKAYTLNKDKSKDEQKSFVYNYAYKLRLNYNEKLARKKLKDFFYKYNSSPLGDTDLSEALTHLQAEINPLTSRTGSSILNESFICDVVDFDNEDNLKDCFKQASASCNPETSIKTPFKRLNMMLGEALGLPRPAAVTFAACTHNYKSGMMIDLYMGIPRFNKPYLKDPTKKPLVLFLSLENEASNNVAQMYTLFREQETGKKINAAIVLSEIINNPNKLEEASKYIASKMNVNGWNCQMIRINPSEFDYTKLFALVEYYQAQGYEIVTLIIDYLLKMSKKGCDAPSGTGSDSRDLFRRIRNYCMARNILLCTPAQLSTTAKSEKANLAKEEGHNPLAFINWLRNANAYDSCRSLEQEIDVEIFLDIVRIQGKRFLAVGRGKHRGALSQTPEDKLTFILPFAEAGRLIPDYDTDNISGYSTVKEAQVAMGGNDYGDDVWE
jgi:hypothetical protein